MGGSLGTWQGTHHDDEEEEEEEDLSWQGNLAENLLYTQTEVEDEHEDDCLLFVGWLLNVLATCECISGTDLLRQFYVLPH